MFKVGDKVRCVSTHPGGVNLTVGKVYTVVEVGGDEIGTSVRNDVGDCSWYRNTRFELVTEAEPKEVKYIIRYDLVNRDPWEEVYSDKELNKRLVELYENKDVIKTSIKVYPTTGALIPQFTVGVKLLGLNLGTKVKLVKNEKSTFPIKRGRGRPGKNK